ncbi:vWA domain-containing protein [Plantactinospora sp. CA-290183]|uniref:vWA domain-containing protein n=1 Tax=Plantactinospora sp. CA-290183 TaxID=3240006 RepID=UPI003D8BC140
MSSAKLDLRVVPERPTARNDVPSDLDLVVEVTTSRGIGDQPAMHALNLCVVIDRSSSMATNDKLEQAKRSCVSIWESLNPADHLTVLAFDDEVVSVVNPQTPPDEVKKRIMALQPGGMTNLSNGWYLGLLELQTYASPGHINRLVLLSDGHANLGEQKPTVLGAESARALDELSVTTSTIGIGNDFQEDLLAALARQSGGRFWYIGDSAIEEIIREEFSGALSVFLERPSVQVNLPPGVTIQQELNDLPKIGGRYRLRPVKANDQVCFAVRLRVNPEKVEDGRITIGAALLDGGAQAREAVVDIGLGTLDEFAASPEEPFVALVVSKYVAAVADEQIIEKIDAGEVTTMVEMLQSQSTLMKELQSKLGGARTVAWDEMDDRQARERRRLEREILENDALIAVGQLIGLLRALGEDGRADGLLELGRKKHRLRGENNMAWNSRSLSDDWSAKEALLRARRAIPALLRQYPDLAEEFGGIQRDIDERLARLS